MTYMCAYSCYTTTSATVIIRKIHMQYYLCHAYADHMYIVCDIEIFCYSQQSECSYVWTELTNRDFYRLQV